MGAEAHKARLALNVAAKRPPSRGNHKGLFDEAFQMGHIIERICSDNGF